MDEISSRSSAYTKTPNINAWQPRPEAESLRYNVTNLYGKENRWEHCSADDSHGWIFAEVVYTIDDVTKYRSIPVSRYSLRRYIIVGHFLIPRESLMKAFKLTESHSPVGPTQAAISVPCRLYPAAKEGRVQGISDERVASLVVVHSSTPAAWSLIHTAPILRAIPTHLVMGNFAEQKSQFVRFDKLT